MVVPLRLMGYGLVPALSHLGKWWYGWSRYDFLPCAPRGCTPIPWSDLSCFLLFRFLAVSVVLFFFIFCKFGFFVLLGDFWVYLR